MDGARKGRKDRESDEEKGGEDMNKYGEGRR